MRKLLAVAGLVVIGFGVPAHAGTRVYVRIGPPAAVVERRVVAPSVRHVWVGGYHRWDGGAYVWVPGRWELPPARRHAWVSGHWAHTRAHGWYWVDGHWR